MAKDVGGIKELQSLIEARKLDYQIVSILQQLSPQYELTPKGFISYLLLLTDMIQ